MPTRTKMSVLHHQMRSSSAAREPENSPLGELKGRNGLTAESPALKHSASRSALSLTKRATSFEKQMITRSSHLSRPAPPNKILKEMQEAFVVYEERLQTMMTTADKLMIQIERWKSGMQEWKVWLDQAQKLYDFQCQKRPEPSVPIPRTLNPHSDASARKRRSEREAMRRYHLDEATRILGNSTSDKVDDDKDIIEAADWTVKTTTESDWLVAEESKKNGSITLPSLSGEYDENKPPLTQTKKPKPMIPKLNIAGVANMSSWHTGAHTQGDVYAEEDS